VCQRSGTPLRDLNRLSPPYRAPSRRAKLGRPCGAGKTLQDAAPCNRNTGFLQATFIFFTCRAKAKKYCRATYRTSQARGVEMSNECEFQQFTSAARAAKRQNALAARGHTIHKFSRESGPYAQLMVAALCVTMMGCATTPKRASTSLFVPGRCLKMTAESFTRPCTQRADGKIICDGVVISATCVAVAPKEVAHKEVAQK